MENYWRKLRQILGGNGRPPKETMLILFLSGILIFVILLPTEKKSGNGQNRKNQGDESQVTENTMNLQQASVKDTGNTTDEYKQRLEEELEDFLTGVSGVGEADVLIYMKDSPEYIVEKDNPMSSSTKGDSSETSKDEATVYTVNENGDEVPFISQTRSPEIDGVLVAAKGASDETVRLQIVRLVMALYGIDANKVEVVAVQ